MSLQDALNKFNQSSNASANGDNGKPSPFDALKQPVLRSSAKEPNMLVRFLPGNGTIPLYSEYRQYWTLINTKKGQKRIAISLPAKGGDILQPIVDAEIKEAQEANKSPRYPSSRYYFNVVPYVQDVNRQLQMKVDINGLPEVHVLEVTNSVVQKLMEAAQNDMFNPNFNPTLLQQYGVQPTADQEGDSFISSALAYPVQLTHSGSGLNTEYGFNVIANYPLAPLPQGWEANLENLDSLVEPTSTQSPDFANYLLQQKGMQTAQQPAQGPAKGVYSPQVGQQAPAQSQPSQYQAYTNTQVFNGMPTNMNTTAAPAAPAQNLAMPTQAPQAPVAPEAPEAPEAPMPWEDQYQQAPAQPQAPVAPQTTATQTTTPHVAPAAPMAPVQPTATPQAPQNPAAGVPAGFGTVSQKAAQTAPAAPQAAPANLVGDMNDILADAGLGDLGLPEL